MQNLRVTDAPLDQFSEREGANNLFGGQNPLNAIFQAKKTGKSRACGRNWIGLNFLIQIIRFSTVLLWNLSWEPLLL